eukprot:GEMP01020733.1.p1 GENE.GEMP01020733.1~~GEMP01020733.1.p1  ORF type:complete len:692 (+),score=153.26 GEMP01020733.1:176-2251(+)
MGFADKIQGNVGGYRPYCLNYSALKEQIKVSLRMKRKCKSTSAGLTNANHAFQERLFTELQKVNNFALVKHEEEFVQLRQICHDLDKVKKNEQIMADAQGFFDVLQSMEQRIQFLSSEICQLDVFIRYNYLGFAKITEKYDVVMEQVGGSWFLSQLHKEPFCNISFDDLLILLSLTWSRFRDVKETSQVADDAEWKPPDNFTRKTLKFWVKLENVILLKTLALRYMPYLIFGSSLKQQEKFLEPLAVVENEEQVKPFMDTFASTMEESQMLSSIYFDNIEAKSYQERIMRDQSARLVRFRWYGDNDGGVDKEVFVERKVHHEGWSLEDSTKERFSLPQKHIFEFMKGRFNIDAYFDALQKKSKVPPSQIAFARALAEEVNGMIQVNKMQPMLRTSYHRCAFQLATSNEVRISLDTTMMLINEYKADNHPNEPWCRVATDLLAEDDVIRFPYAILEVKLSGVEDNPSWVQEMLNSCECTQVYKFSKFQHGMAFLHPNLIPVAPHWFEDFHQMRVREATVAQGKSKVRGLTHRTGSAMTPMYSALLYSQETSTDIEELPLQAARKKGYHAIKDIQLIEPKLYFANERTFIHYAEHGAIIVTLIHFMLTLGTKETRFVAMLLAITYIMWCYMEYAERNEKLHKRVAADKREESQLHTRRGAHVLLFVAFSMITTSLCVSINHQMFGLPQSENNG